MMCIPVLNPDGKIRILMILEKENLDRILKYDPCDLWLNNLPDDFKDKPVEHIGICYATPEEMEVINILARQDKLMEILKIVTRGFHVEQADLKRSSPYEVITPTDKGTT